MFAFIEEGGYVAVYSTRTSHELFYVLKVIEKCVAQQDEIDIYGHLIQNGAQYIKGYYLEKLSDRKGKVAYKQLNKIVYFYPSKCFCPAVFLDKDLCMPLGDYQFLADTI